MSITVEKHKKKKTKEEFPMHASNFVFSKHNEQCPFNVRDGGDDGCSWWSQLPIRQKEGNEDGDKSQESKIVVVDKWLPLLSKTQLRLKL